MSERTYKVSEVVGTSTDGVDDAIRNGIKKTAETVRNLDWFEVVEIRGYMGEGGSDVDYFQVSMKLGFRVE